MARAAVSAPVSGLVGRTSPAKRQRVLMLLENFTYPQDGRVRREAQTLRAAGHDVTVICPAGDGQLWKEEIDGVRVYRYPRPPEGAGLIGYLHEYATAMLWSGVLSLFVLTRHGFDAVHAHNPPDTFVFIGAFYKLLGKSFVFDHHDLSPEMYLARFGKCARPLVYRTLVALEQLSCRLADVVIATNQSYREIEMSRGDVPARRITVVRNGPELGRLRPVLEAPLPGVGAELRIVYVGVMGVQDGVDYLLRALAHLAHRIGRKDFRCVLVGDGDAVPALRNLSDDLLLSDRVVFAGWVEQSEVAIHLASAHICVAPEPSNAYNDRSTVIKLTEYMAAARPIVAFDLPEHRFTAGAAAVYARPNDVLDFAEKLVALMDDPAARRMMGEAGRRRIEQQLSWDHQAPKLVETYRRLGSVPNWCAVPPG